MPIRVLLAVLVLLVVYFLAWPVAVDPVAWQAPVDRGLVDPFESNDRLQFARSIDIAPFEGPEDAAVGIDGSIYLTTKSGHVLRVQGRRFEEFANPGGRPLGIERDRDGSLVVANAFVGIQRIDREGAVTDLLTEIDGQPLKDANNLAIGPDGRVYFSVSSTRFSSVDYDDTYEASLLDIMEHGGHGLVYEFDPATGGVTRLLDGLNYANGVALSADGEYLVIAETGHYRVLKLWIEGPHKGRREVLLENLPGFPDNLKTGLDGRFWLGLVAPRNALLDKLSDKPLLRSMVQRLPAFVRPKAVPSSHVFAFDANGVVLEDLQDSEARFPALTGVLETRQTLYLTSLFGNRLSRLDKRDL